jgi:RNA 3'-terminal phosphate cyclase
MLKIKFDQSFEYSVLLSLLSRKPVEFTDVNCTESAIEILEYFKIISPSSTYKLNNSTIIFNPEFLIGGKIKADATRIPLCLRNIITISPFLPDSIELELDGITNYDDMSVDIF